MGAKVNEWNQVIVEFTDRVDIEDVNIDGKTVKAIGQGRYIGVNTNKTVIGKDYTKEKL